MIEFTQYKYSIDNIQHKKHVYTNYKIINEWCRECHTTIINEYMISLPLHFF